MALNKNFDMGDISFGELKTEEEVVTKVVNEKEPKATKRIESDNTPKEEKSIPNKEEKVKAPSSSEETGSSTGVKLITNKKSLKTEHKNFLFDKELADQLKKVAKKTGLSENEVVSQILKQTLSQLLDD